MTKSFVVVGIGELLWDMFPSGKRLGGAPVNFSYHCHQLGAAGYPASAVGGDELGAEIRSVLAEKGIADIYIEEVDHPTGTVQVQLEQGKPSYEICEGVAWDHIPMSGKLDSLAKKTDAVCFGSLAQRASVSRKTIQQFLSSMRPDALKVFDINLRQDFYSAEVIEESLNLCNILKLSDEELPVLSDLFSIEGTVDEQLGILIEKFDLKLIAYTRGPDGSLLAAVNDRDDHPGLPGKATNSVGAGDSFTAALCMGLLQGRSLPEINLHALQVSTFVCMQDSATPMLPAALLE
jgi:fructokinase